MTTDLRAHLQDSLGSAYTLERELGGGGMSRVFVATDTRLERPVVVKVLAPELAAGLSAERFAREIKLSAALQEPHIVPVLAAGQTADGVPYYTMPFVAGESLRDRLARGPVALPEALGILRDVATALEYAHGRGVIHRDVKPANVLLSGRTAVVTDFGIAKAIAVSKTHEARVDGTLTQMGVSLGTPAYMAPEQAAGDPHLDARADVYAWGVLAYELLAGRHPFADRTTASQLMAAHLGETPAPLARVAPAVSPALAALITRCLAKEPAARPGSAAELVAALDAGIGAGWASGADHRAARRRRGWRLATGVVGALAVLVLAGWYLTPAELRAGLRTLATRAPATLRVNRVVVAAFRNETGDPKLAPLGALAADYVTDGLSRLGSLQVVDARTAAVTGEVVSRIPRFFRPGDEQALGEETGAKVVVAGAYYRAGDSLVFRARILDAGTGAVRTALEPVAAPAAAPSAGVAALSAHVVAALRAASDVDEVRAFGLAPPPSLAAYAAYREGWEAFLNGRPDSAVFGPLWRAMALDSTYAAPAVMLAFVAPLRGADAVGDSALVRARRLRDRLTPTEQALVDATEAGAEGDVTAALEAAQRTGSPQLVALYAMGARRPRLAVAALTATDPDRGLNLRLGGWYWATLAAAYAQLGEYDRALAAVREGERRVPAMHQAAMDLSIAGARGDVKTVRDGLEARWRAGEWPLVAIMTSTTLLRMRGGHEAEGRALATQWAERVTRATRADTLPPYEPVWEAELLGAAERWPEATRVMEAAFARIPADSAREHWSAARTAGTRLWRREIRAVPLVHVGQPGEALALDSVLARTEGTRWDRGASALQRGVLAAHLGARDQAVSLFARSIAQGSKVGHAGQGNGLGTVGEWPFDLPLRTDPRFQALWRPDPSDAH